LDDIWSEKGRSREIIVKNKEKLLKGYRTQLEFNLLEDQEGEQWLIKRREV